MDGQLTFAFSWAKRLKGFWSGSGACHSVYSSPYSLVTTTLCFQMKRSLQACLAVARVPLASGSAGSLVVVIVYSTGLRKDEAQHDRLWKTQEVQRF